MVIVTSYLSAFSRIFFFYKMSERRKFSSSILDKKKIKAAVGHNEFHNMTLSCDITCKIVISLLATFADTFSSSKKLNVSFLIILDYTLEIKYNIKVIFLF